MKGSEFLEGVQRVDMSPPKGKLLISTPDIIIMEGDQIVGFQHHVRAKTPEEVDEVYKVLEKGLLTVISGDTGAVEQELPLDSNFTTRNEPINVTPVQAGSEVSATLGTAQGRITKLKETLHRINPFKDPDPLDPSIEF